MQRDMPCACTVQAAVMLSYASNYSSGKLCGLWTHERGFWKQVEALEAELNASRRAWQGTPPRCPSFQSASQTAWAVQPS